MMGAENPMGEIWPLAMYLPLLDTVTHETWLLCPCRNSCFVRSPCSSSHHQKAARHLGYCKAEHYLQYILGLRPWWWWNCFNVREANDYCDQEDGEKWQSEVILYHATLWWCREGRLASSCRGAGWVHWPLFRRIQDMLEVGVVERTSLFFQTRIRVLLPCSFTRIDVPSTRFRKHTIHLQKIAILCIWAWYRAAHHSTCTMD